MVIPAAKVEDSPGTHLQGIAEILLTMGHRDFAAQLLEAAISTGFDGFGTESGFGANSDLWNLSRISRLLTLLDENGFRDLQLEVVDLLEEFLAREPSPNAQEQALHLIFTTFLDRGELGPALSTADRISDAVAKWVGYGDVAVAHATAGRLDDALETAGRIGNSKFRGKANARIAAALADQGKIELAVNVLSDAPPDIETTTAHKAITSALVAAGQFDEAIAYADALFGKFQRAFVQDSTAGALADAGELEKALALAKSISVRQQKAQAMATVGEELVERGEIALARDLLAEMPRFAFWQDPVDESLDQARDRLTRALEAAANR